MAVLTLGDTGFADARALLARFGLALVQVADGEPIPGSYWGECEAGIIGGTVYARADTPLHSLLHEAGHLIVLPPARRAARSVLTAISAPACGRHRRAIRATCWCRWWHRRI